MKKQIRPAVAALALGLGLGIVGDTLAQGVAVQSVRIGEHEGKSRLVLDLSGNVGYQYSLSPDRRQVIVDLNGVDWTAPTSRAYRKSQFVLGYRVQDNRLIIETTKPVKVAAAQMLTPNGQRSYRLYFDIARAPEYLTAMRAYTGPTAESAPQPAPMAETAAPRPAPMAEMADSRFQPAAPEAAPAQPVERMGETDQPVEPLTATKPENEEPMSFGGQQMAQATEGRSTRGRSPSTSNDLYFRFDVGYGMGGDADLTQSGTAGSLDEIGGALAVDVGLGYRFLPQMRGDVTVNYLGGHSVDDTAGGATYDADITSTQVMMNGYWDILDQGSVVPYVGAGLGAAFNTLDDVKSSTGTTVKGADTTALAYQLMAGAGWRFDSGLVFDFGYRYLNAGALESGNQTTAGATANKFEGELIDHQFMVGSRIEF